MPLHSTDDFRPSWGNLWAPPLLFRRRPPQSNCLPDYVLYPDNGYKLVFQNNQGGISRTTQHSLTTMHQSLPPILHKLVQKTKPSYSKAPRGLSVLLWVIRIFTDISISPGLSLRQCSIRYAFRAGRNLPDKEFRYLRTVIVTAAVHWGFSSMLHSEELTSPINLPALGRRQPLYITLRFSRDLCFW
jgi:hypothetical protein